MNLHEMLTNFGVILLVFQQGNLVGVKMEVQFRGVLVVFLVILVDKAKGVSRWAQKVGILAVVCRLEEGIREANGRAEAEIGVVRRAVNTLIKASGDGEEYWPLMAKHVGERRGRQQLAVLGLVTPKLLPWGQRVMITTKGWDDFQGHWRARKKAGVVRGPDPDMSLTSGGHLVEVEDGKLIRTDDMVVPGDPPALADVVEVEARDEPASILDRVVKPRRRLTEKTALASVSIEEVLVDASLANLGEHWVVTSAMYGLVTSPKDWSVYRDSELRSLKEKETGMNTRWFGFRPLEDSNLWAIQEWKDGSEKTTGEWGVVLGYMIVYVDDILMVGSRPVTDAASATIKRIWATSNPEYAEPGGAPMRFLGIEIQRLVNGAYYLHQGCYVVREVLDRHVGGGSSSFIKVPEEKEENAPSLREVREAQKITGELLWLSGKTRPDIVDNIYKTTGSALQISPK
eukprot:g17845.t1